MSILVVGMICYDVVNTCERFPYEDEEMRYFAAALRILIMYGIICTADVLVNASSKVGMQRIAPTFWDY